MGAVAPQYPVGSAIVDVSICEAKLFQPMLHLLYALARNREIELETQRELALENLVLRQ